MPNHPLMILSGMPVGTGGAGFCLQHIQQSIGQQSIGQQSIGQQSTGHQSTGQQSTGHQSTGQQSIGGKPQLGITIRTIFTNRSYLVKFIWRKWHQYMDKDQPLLIFHPQSLGYVFTLRILERRSFTWIYTLDNSFFCRKSYNHLDHESEPCLKCLKGNFDQAVRHQCPSFPNSRPKGLHFEARLRNLARNRQIGFFSQSSTQEELLRSHFGPNAIIETVGMWADFDHVERNDDVLPSSLPKDFDAQRTILFHGIALHAKGIEWTLKVMEHCPHYRFLFPFPPQYLEQLKIAIPDEVAQRCIFLPVSWKSGLKWLTRRCFLTLSPSLWSAPIDGALIKSLMIGNHVGVVDNPSAFCRILPDNILWKFSPRAEEAAKQITALPPALPHHDSQARRAWLDEFRTTHRPFPQRMIEIVAEHASRTCGSP